MDLKGMNIRSVKEGAVIPRDDGAWGYSVVVNGVAVECDEDWWTAYDARMEMRDEVRNMRIAHHLEPAMT